MIGGEEMEAEGGLRGYEVGTALPFRVDQSGSRRERKYERDGHWNERQKLKYTIFLTYFQDLLLDPRKKKSVRIYDMMADMIITRNSNQCRSHHQKMEKHRSNIPEIIASVAEKYEPTLYRELEQKYLVFIKILLQNCGKYTRHSTNIDKIPPAERVVVVRTRPTPQLSAPCLDPPAVEAFAQQEKNDKGKEIMVKTADSYNEESLSNKDEVDDLPRMTLSDPKLKEPEGVESVAAPPNFLMYGYSSVERLVLSEQERLYYEEQIQVMELKRQWHIHNAHILSAQLAGERQCIENCESTLELYRLALIHN